MNSNNNNKKLAIKQEIYKNLEILWFGITFSEEKF